MFLIMFSENLVINDQFHSLENVHPYVLYSFSKNLVVNHQFSFFTPLYHMEARQGERGSPLVSCNKYYIFLYILILSGK